MLIGRIEQIVRHPVKSLRGESVRNTKVMKYGLYGDRSHAYIDETKKGKFLTITQFPEMVQYSARFQGEEQSDIYPRVIVQTPEGEVLDWNDRQLLNEMGKKSNREVSTIEYSPSHVPIGPIAEEHLLLVTDASLHKIEEIWGSEIDSRRFRPNLVLNLNDKVPFIEEEWFGKRIRIGNEVEIELVRYCKRCMIITVDPVSSKRDSSLHKAVIKERNNHFGVYASVIKTGNIQVNDEVHLLQETKNKS
ncbi:MOSC domain-containing protein [Cytobacillus gottheilii]|uniref:MOSC domain-containing protein n=1 Tax=Cytobacillus gottheilii TaxID=859144 RepID=UPI0009BA5CC7|nr:MOSC N-terminal beta barrel domain-containing protein [Cytobacillus gottheilii]